MNARLLLVPVALACAAASVGSAVSAAAAPLQPRTARVSFADLDVASSAGRAALQQRIADAADSVCRSNGYADLAAIRASNQCIETAIDDAMRQAGPAVEFAGRQASAGGR